MPKWVNQDDYIRFCRKITLSLAPGEYVFGFVLKTLHPDDYVRLPEFDTNDYYPKKIQLWCCDQMGFFRIMPCPGKGVKKSHGGICDLPGDCHIQLVSNT